MLRCGAAYCSEVRRVAVYCSMVQCVAVSHIAHNTGATLETLENLAQASIAFTRAAEDLGALSILDPVCVYRNVCARTFVCVLQCVLQCVLHTRCRGPRRSLHSRSGVCI